MYSFCRHSDASSSRGKTVTFLAQALVPGPHRIGIMPHSRSGAATPFVRGRGF